MINGVGRETAHATLTSKAGDGLSTACFVKCVHELFMAFLLPGKLSVRDEDDVGSLRVDKPLALTLCFWPYMCADFPVEREGKKRIRHWCQNKKHWFSCSDADLRLGCFQLSATACPPVYTQLLACHCASDQKQPLTVFTPFDDKLYRLFWFLHLYETLSLGLFGASTSVKKLVISLTFGRLKDKSIGSMTSPVPLSYCCYGLLIFPSLQGTSAVYNYNGVRFNTQNS